MRRKIHPDDMIVLKHFSDFPLVNSMEYRNGVICECGAIIRFRNRRPSESVLIVCPKCGLEIQYG